MIIRGGGGLDSSPEEMQGHMAKWQKWMGGLAAAGQLGGGEPLMSEGKSITNSGATVLDRPLAEGKELVGGYIIFKTDSLEAATELAKGCPGLQEGSDLEIREIRKMG